LEFQKFAVRYICEKYPKFNARQRFMNKHLDAGFELVDALVHRRLSMEYLGEKSWR